MDEKIYETIFKTFDKIEKMDKIEKATMIEIIRPLSKSVSVHDLSIATAILRKNGRYVQENYREKYLEVYIKYFIMRLKDINQDKNKYDNDYVDMDGLHESINIIKSQMKVEENEHRNDKFPLIYALTSLYTTYILEEPIHPVGTPFPGNLHITYEDGIFYCPVKKNNENNPKAVCKFCLAEQTKEN
ncbi:MAG: DUF2115 domain-containing protein [Methanobrevibacter sp.]|nr:DUF2115 domain-containing protein [Candidatus Methanovirga meridionalis]